MFSVSEVAVILSVFVSVRTSDITKSVFGPLTDGMPAAFGDFNSDELTDIFVLRDNSTTVEIFLSAEEEPLLRTSKSKPLKCTFSKNFLVTSVVPGDFDGDALMDVMVTAINKERNEEGAGSQTLVYILWGGATNLTCMNESQPLVVLKGQPLAIDYNQDMIIDLFGSDVEGQRCFFIFGKDRGQQQKIPMKYPEHKHVALKRPHSHAFLGKKTTI